jgi:hypothetical protein
MRRVLLALLAGAIIVAVLLWLNHARVATAQTFTLLLPGIIVACMSPDASCSPVGDVHPPGMIAMTLEAAVNVLLYGGLVYLLVVGFARFGRALSN